MKTDHNTEDILNSLDNIRRAEPGPFLYDRILSRVHRNEASLVPGRLVWLAAASLAIIIFINIWIVRDNFRQKETASVEKIADAYGLLNTNTISYN